MLPDDQLPPGMGRLEGVFNAGVGGDRIQNVAFRLVGHGHGGGLTQNSDPEARAGSAGVEVTDNGDGEGGEEREELTGLMQALVDCGAAVKLWVVQMGTNNLTVKKGLVDRDVDAMKVLLRGLLAFPLTGVEEGRESMVLVTGLSYRRDVSRALVDEANKKLVVMVKELNEEVQRERVVFLPATDKVKTEEHLVDHVHLSLGGYQLWVRELFPAVVSLLEKVGGDPA
jgi:platelet-activating factor acetylhydrolase IB subunit beta/gamma